MNRIIHRVGALLAVLLMLWLSGTGSLMQLIDLKTVLADAPPIDPTAVSMQEGMYGPANYAVIQLSDFGAATLPTGFDLRKGFETVLQAARPPTDAAGPRDPMAWAELRVVDGKPIGQVMKGNLEAFDAQTGAPVPAVQPNSIPQGGRLPPSLRQKIKTLHRFWNRGDTPGVYFELLSGLVLWTLIITGLIMYFRLLNARARVGRRQLFWLTGGTWRGLHRAISVLAAVFLVCIAFSGTWIGFESSYSPALRAFNGPPGQGGGGRRAPITPLSDDQVLAMTDVTLQSMQTMHPGTPIKVIRLRTFGQMKQGVVIAEDTRPGWAQQLVFNAESGKTASLTEPEYPKANFPFGVQTHENMKHFHSGEMFGVSGQMMNLLAGLSLLFLSISGLTVYFAMWLKRREAGRGSFIWK